VHLYGNARLFSSREDLHQMLHELIETFEPAYSRQWETMSQTFRENMLRQIVGFEIVATRIEGKFKLSQNRTREDQTNVIASLEKSRDTVVSEVAHMMKEQGLGKIAADKEEK
jgi:transcriptional regulator